jgi:ECF transporter S component (folate family)
MKQTRVLVYMALFISMEIILTRFFAIQTSIVRIGFGFIPIAFSGIMFGPVIGGLTAMLADIVGMIIMPKGAYFPGFTFSALLTGAIYGFFLYSKPKTIFRIFMATLVINLFVDLGLNTLWLTMLTGNAAAAILPARLAARLVVLPLQTVMVYVLWRYLRVFIENSLGHFSKRA